MGVKWITLVKAFDQILVHEWHSGSCTSYESSYGLDSKEEAEQAIRDIIKNRFYNNTDRYQFTTCVLSYDESQAEAIDKFFKYM